jgi:hypothetical protein
MNATIRCRNLIAVLAGIMAVGFAGAPQEAEAAIQGAIFTTDAAGTVVNGNIYSSKGDVYLDGGPQPNAPCTAAGLPNGDYYFQVTDPSGATLLSTDNVQDRRITVSGGLVTSVAGSVIPHATGTGKCAGSISVQLLPYGDTPNPGGEYKVWVTPVSAYPCDPTTTGAGCGSGSFGFVPGNIKTDNFKAPDGSTPPQDTSTISGTKFYDANVNGINNDTEAGIQGWQVCISGGPQGFTPFCTTTDASGFYSFTGLNDGTYGVCENIPANPPAWVPTTPTGIAGITVPFDSVGNNFGNVCLGAGGGKTLGFWSNKNGQNIITNGTCLVGLNQHTLVNGSGSTVTPFASYAAFRTWLLSANATNMAYMLSAQKAAMLLNRNCSRAVGGSTLVYAPGCGNTGLNNAFISIDNLISAADTQISANPFTTAASDPANRAVQECLKNALDAGNNNQNFVQSGPCAVSYAGTESCTP